MDIFSCALQGGIVPNLLLLASMNLLDACFRFGSVCNELGFQSSWSSKRLKKFLVQKILTRDQLHLLLKVRGLLFESSSYQLPHYCSWLIVMVLLLHWKAVRPHPLLSQSLNQLTCSMWMYKEEAILRSVLTCLIYQSFYGIWLLFHCTIWGRGVCFTNTNITSSAFSQGHTHCLVNHYLLIMCVYVCRSMFVISVNHFFPF